MTVTFPSWYEGGYPDIEQVVVQMLKPHLQACDPAISPVTFLPTNYTIDKVPVVWLQRLPVVAPHHDSEVMDWPLITLRVIAASRADAWAVTEFTRTIMLSYYRGGPVTMPDNSVVNLSGVRESLSPTQLEEMHADFRLVPTSYRISLRLPRGLPDYAAIRPSSY